MARIKCKNCGKEISDTMENCPYCGSRMSETEEAAGMTQKNVDALKKTANEPAKRRKSLLTPKERSVVFGILFAVLAGLLTLSLDLIPVPEEDWALWLMMAGLYAVLILVTVFLERLLVKKLSVHRTLYYVTVQLVLLIAIIALVVIGIRRNSESVYEVSTEFSYALALGVTEIVFFLYHLGRVIVLAIMNNSKKNTKKKAGKNKKK